MRRKNHVIAATGAKVQVTGYDRWRVFVERVFTYTYVRTGKHLLAALIHAHGELQAAEDIQELLSTLAASGELVTFLSSALLRADDGL